ncbi:MAG TPA: glycosyltransferase family 4 protein [Blastocatellia bacterium]|nr:glycosyltransferase family 4 protein [Blastocatellia bacterium]
MKILFVIHTPKDPLTAVYADAMRRAHYFSAQGHPSEVLTPNDFSWLQSVSPRWYPLLYPVVIAGWLTRKARNYDAVILHSYAGWMTNLLRHVLPSLRHIRTITSFHGLEPLCFSALKAAMAEKGRPLSLRYRLMQKLIAMPLIQLSCRRSDLVTCLNSREADYLATEGWASPAKIKIQPNTVDKPFFKERQARNQALNLLFVGQWIERKGIKYLVEAFSAIAASRPDLRLWCVGTRVDGGEVLPHFPESVRDQVVVIPHVSRKEMIKFYFEADLFVFPSFFEGSSLALLEAMASGLPVITTPVGSASDILESEISALLVPVADSSALTVAIERVLGDFSLRQRLGHQAQEVAKQFEFSGVTRNDISIIQGLIGNDGSLIFEAR